MKSLLTVSVVLLLASWMAACSVVMEATRPTPVDLNYFQTGMTRDQVLDKLGAPDTTAIESDEESCDFYKLYTRGYGAGGKVPIAVAEAAADFFTIGLAEAVLTPTEGVTRNEKHPVAFCYVNQKLVRVTLEATSSPTATATPGVSAIESDTASSPATAPSPSPNAQPSSMATPRPGR